MSLCNTFRLFVISLIIVLSSIDKPAAFTLRRTNSEPKDLAQEETVVLEVINVNGPNETQSNNIKRDELKTNSSNAYDVDNKMHENNDDLRERSSTIFEGNSKEISTITEQNPYTTIPYEKTTNLDAMTSIIENSEEKPGYGALFLETVTELLDTSTIEDDTTVDIMDQMSTKEFVGDKPFTYETTEETPRATETIPKTTSVIEKPDTTQSFEPTKLSSLKKYETIERKRLTNVHEEKTGTNKTEEMVKAETKRSRVSLQDTITSAIPSLEQLKSDLLSSTVNQIAESKEGVTESLFFSEYNTHSPMKLYTVETKRAGYLDLLQKTTTAEQSTAKETSDINIPKDDLRAMFDTDAETDIPEEKLGSRAESQSQLNEDVIKEELLKEEVINDNKDNFKRTDAHSAETETQTNSSAIDDLSVKPIIHEKFKNSSLYTVSPNYKPLKKIEVKPPKLFVRDPDDNSWRNESLSSLGIVFNPKNSSKPFTQVLKNKTETEWNNLTDKDSKNDMPDLRERLQKMAEKRKSKRKKIDSFGNVYFDYEENSNSVEQTPTDEIPLNVTSTTELSSTAITSIEKPLNITSAITSTTAKADKERDPYTTRKYKKFFNIPEYYDATDEDDTDYLNMAKIDIKKFTTPKKTTTLSTTTSPVKQQTFYWSFNKTPRTNPPGRKATIQYFPPLTTQKVNINDYDTDFKYKVDSFTETESPKKVLPVDKSTTPKAIQYKILKNDRLRDNMITHKPNLDKNLYLTQSPQTTQPGYPLLNDDDAFDKDSYVIRHYKDFINAAVKGNEYERNLDYIPFTDGPVRGFTKTDIPYEPEKPKMNVEEEYDYETQFRKDVLQRFVNNFNQHSDRFKTNFPVLFNNSVVHQNPRHGDVASSRAFLRGYYGGVKEKQEKPACDPNCENITVELSPSYELHYYVPEQEEKEEVVPEHATLPYPYRL